jgi:uncharacterized membrane-anchored protein YhcB (DUF1043 family)
LKLSVSADKSDMSVVREDLTYHPEKVAQGELLRKAGLALLVGALLGYFMAGKGDDSEKWQTQNKDLQTQVKQLTEEKQDLVNKITNLEATGLTMSREINGLRAQLNAANEELEAKVSKGSKGGQAKLTEAKLTEAKATEPKVAEAKATETKPGTKVSKLAKQ